MIKPTAEDLIREVSKSLEMDVLPALPKGPAQNQLKAALHLFNRLARTWNRAIPVLMQDNRDLSETLRAILQTAVEQNGVAADEAHTLIAEIDATMATSHASGRLSTISVDDLAATNATLQDTTIRVRGYLRARSIDGQCTTMLLALLQRSNARELYMIGESSSLNTLTL